MYKLTGVTKIYQKGRRTVPAVRDLDLVIQNGEWLAVQGRTGHGKSTLLNLLGGLDRPTEGVIELDGVNLGALRETQLTAVRAEKIGFIFQTFNLIPTLSAAENVEAALIPLRVGHADRQGPGAGPAAAGGVGRRGAPPPPARPGGAPAPGSGARRSPGPWSRNPRCCWPTSRPATSTRTPATRSSVFWSIYGANEGSAWSWSRTTPAWPARRSASGS